MNRPAPRWYQNELGSAVARPRLRKKKPTRSVTTAVQSPPPEIRSATKYQPRKTPMAVMKGNSNRRRSSTAAASTSSVALRRASENPWNGWEKDDECSQPNQRHSAKTKTAQATTLAKAKLPADSQFVSWPNPRPIPSE